MKDKTNQCRHFTGMLNRTCGKCHVYVEVRDDNAIFPNNFPCDGSVATCPDYEPRTEEEIAAEEAEVMQIASEMFSRMITFENRETEDCPQCSKHVDKLEQVGRCVYARPCNCRVWQGVVPEKWISAE